MSDQAKLPVSLEELNEMGVDTSEVPDGMTYAAIYSSPYDAKRGLKRWIDDDCPDPFKFSSSYTKLFNECVNLKEAHATVTEDLVDVCKEREDLNTKVKNLENGIGEKELAITDATSEKAMNGYRVESLTGQLESANVEITSLKNGIQRYREDLAVEKNETSRLNAQVEELNRTTETQQEEISGLNRDLTSDQRLNQSLRNRLEGTGWRRFICRLFGI